MSRLLCLVVWLSALGIMPPLQAVPVANLNSASVPVLDNSDAEFQRALPEAFRAVLRKISGSSQAIRGAAGMKMVGLAKQYNTLFGYERGPEGGLLLRGDFDLEGVSGALRARGLPVLGRERPQVLAWLAVNDGTSPALQASVTTQEIFDALSVHFAARGMPLVKPRADSTVLALLQDSQPSSAVMDAIALASAPYDAPALVFVVLSLQPDQSWRAEWHTQVMQDDEPVRESGEFSNALPIPLLIDALDQALDGVTKYFTALPSGAVDALAIVVQGVETADDYGRTLGYLQELDGVQRVAVSQVEGSTVTFELTARGGLAKFTQNISFGQTLQVDAASATTFRLRGR